MLCFVFQLKTKHDIMTGEKRLLPLSYTFRWNLFPFVSHTNKPKTLVLQQVCSIIPTNLCHHPSQVCKGVWELVTSFAHMESECKLFRNCDPGRVLFVEEKWTNLLGCVGKYPHLFKSGSAVLVQRCGMSYWDSSAPLWSLGWMSLDWVGSGIAILLLCILLCSIRHWQLSNFPSVHSLSNKLSLEEKGKKLSPQNAAFPCPEPRIFAT